MTATDEITLIKRDGELPDDLDWSADILVSPEHPDEPVRTHDEHWMDAITRCEDIRETVEYPDSPYFMELEGPNDHFLMVAFSFKMKVSEDGEITAEGRCHPTSRAWGGEYETDIQSVIASRHLTVRPHSERTRAAIAAFTEAWH